MKRALTFMILLATVVSATAETKVGFVNMKTLFGKYYKTKDQDAALKTKRDIVKKYGEKLRDDLVRLDKEFKQLSEEVLNPALSPEARKNIEEDAKMKRTSVLMKDKQIREYMTKQSNQMKKEYEASRNSVVAEIRKEISVFATKLKYDMIIDVSGESANMVPVVVYYDKTKDITNVILRRLNAGHEVEEKKEK